MASGPVVKVLLVDDNPGDRTLYQHLLADDPGCEYEFFEAATAVEGLQPLQSRVLDCVLLDLYLPDMSGLEFLEAFSQRRIRAKPPVIMLTGQGSESFAVDAMKAGAAEYLAKGAVSSESLARAIGNALEKHGLRMEVQSKFAARSCNSTVDRFLWRVNLDRAAGFLSRCRRCSRLLMMNPNCKRWSCRN